MQNNESIPIPSGEFIHLTRIDWMGDWSKILTRIFLKSALSFGGNGSLEGIAGNKIPENCFLRDITAAPQTIDVLIVSVFCKR